MNKIIRFYNQSRQAFWGIIIVIVLIFAFIRILNSWAREKNRNPDTSKQLAQNEVYYQESQSLVSGGSVSEYNRDTYGSLITNFLNYCISGNTEKAYELLSDDCKRLLYPSLQRFENSYYIEKFDTPKTYKFQSWTSEKANIYLIKLYEDSLSTGNATLNEYIEDYYSVVKENGTAKLNINRYVKTEEINKSNKNNNIDIKVDSIDYYMDYCICNITVENTALDDIVLDAKIDSDSTYLLTVKGAKLISLLYEKNLEDLVVNSNSKKKIDIKFNASYSDYLLFETINFNEIVRDYYNDGILDGKRESMNIEI